MKAVSKTITVEIALPDWVKWVATDENGEVYGFSHKPIQKDCIWYVRSQRHVFVRLVKDIGTDCPNWRETLRKV